MKNVEFKNKLIAEKKQYTGEEWEKYSKQMNEDAIILLRLIDELF